jgi:hypothetical protein
MPYALPNHLFALSAVARADLYELLQVRFYLHH